KNGQAVISHIFRLYSKERGNPNKKRVISIIFNSESFSGYGSMINSNGCASLTPIPNRIV
ncbi:hypothetical protein BLOT_010027, partial [Blomia tropicalis]